MSEQTWHGYLEAASLKPAIVATGHAVADGARAGEWERMLAALPRHRLGPNSWRPGGSSWFTPLHQAAWLGAPADVVQRLVGLGAWRRLPTADGRTALDLARDRGHAHLLEPLTPPPPPGRVVSDAVLALLDVRLAELVEGRIRPHLTDPLRHPVTAVLTEIEDRSLWYPVPGMYGGFSVRLREQHLYVESWSRVAGGSGQAHVVTTAGAELVDEGFV